MPLKSIRKGTGSCECCPGKKVHFPKSDDEEVYCAFDPSKFVKKTAVIEEESAETDGSEEDDSSVEEEDLRIPASKRDAKPVRVRPGQKKALAQASKQLGKPVLQSGSGAPPPEIDSPSNGVVASKASTSSLSKQSSAKTFIGVAITGLVVIGFVVYLIKMLKAKPVKAKPAETAA